MSLTRRSTVRRLAALSALAAGTACTNLTEPLRELTPSEPLAAKGNVSLTHPAGTLAQRVPLTSTPWGIAVSSRGVVLTVLPYANAVGGFSLSDPTTPRALVPVGQWPLDVIFNKTGTLAYVSTGVTGNIEVIDVRSNTVKESIPVGPDIYRLALSQDESRIYATTLRGRLWTAKTHGDPRPTYVDLADTWSPVQGRSLSPSGTDLYVASTNGSIWRLDPVTLAVRMTIALTGRAVQDIAVTPDGSALWAADENGSILRLDPNTLAPTAIIGLTAFGGRPFGLAVSPDGARVYAASSLTGTLFIIAETAPNTLETTSLSTGGAPRRIAFGENGAAAVVSNESGWVDIIR